ncbi:MAG: hypothetical protein ACJASL_001364 [Paraglaciecola sp.]|jgi:hypothetical protein
MRVGFYLEKMMFVNEITQLNINSQRTIQQQTAEFASTNRKLDEALQELKGL